MPVWNGCTAENTKAIFSPHFEEISVMVFCHGWKFWLPEALQAGTVTGNAAAIDVRN